MSLTDILVCTDSTDAGVGRLKLAVQLARKHNAYLASAYVLDGGVGSPGRAEEGESRFREALRLYRMNGEWRLINGPDVADVIEMTKLVDLVILGQYSRGANGTGFRPDKVAIACGRPLLIVPYVGEFLTVGQQVLVAWDGTREATRALNDAMPLIEGAESATVMTVFSRERQYSRAHAALQQVIGHLERHGIQARAEETLRGDLTISDLLLSRAADLGADMMIAGAYHHSKLREALIGGVSRGLLRHMTVPVLMSH